MSNTSLSASTRASARAGTSKERAVAGTRPPRTKGRSPAHLALAVLLILAGAAGGAALQVNGDNSTQVVVAAREIPMGTVISEEDLAADEISGGGAVAAIAGGDARELLGQTATTQIPAGTLLNVDMVDPAPPPGPGQVGVGLALEAGQLPTGELTAGRHVQVLLVPAAQETGTEVPVSQVVVEDAEVLSVTADPSGAWLVALAVDEADAADVSAAAAVKRVSLGLLPYAPDGDSSPGTDG